MENSIILLTKYFIFLILGHLNWKWEDWNLPIVTLEALVLICRRKEITLQKF